MPAQGIPMRRSLNGKGIKVTPSTKGGIAVAITTGLGVPFIEVVSGGLPVVFVSGADTTPDAFSFTDVSNATLATQYTSNAITVAGLGVGASAPVTVAGATYSKNGGAYTSSAGTAQNGDTFAVRHTSSALNSTATNTTLTIGGVSDTYTTTTLALATLDAPVLARTSAAGAAPLTWTTSLNMSNTFAGDFVRYQVATDSGFTAIVQDILHFLTPSEIETADINITADGFVTPSGLYYMRARVERDGGLTSAWSNTLTDTISAATTTFTATPDGVNKNGFAKLTDANLTVYMDRNDVGANCGSRAVQAAGPNEFVFEILLTDIDTVNSGATWIGIDDGTPNLNSYARPGEGASSGAGLEVTSSGFSNAYWNSGGFNSQAATALVDGDTIRIVGNKTTRVVKFYRNRSNTLTLLHTTGTISGAWTTWYASVGHSRVASSKGNFGQVAFNPALSGSEAAYG